MPSRAPGFLPKAMKKVQSQGLNLDGTILLGLGLWAHS